MCLDLGRHLGGPAVIRSLAEIEKEAILEAIIEKRHIGEAAKALGIGQTTIYRRMQQYGIALKVNQIIGELRKQKPLAFVAKAGKS